MAEWMRPRLVFVHGGMHTGTCWSDCIDALVSLCPGLETMAVDLPGRRLVPGNLATLTIDECVASVVQQVDDAGSSTDVPIVLVGHSLAGVVLPGVVERLRATGKSVRQVVFVACCVPPFGECVLDMLPSVIKLLTRASSVLRPLPSSWARYFLGNNATNEQRVKIRAALVPESVALLTEVRAAELPATVRKSWVLTRRDRALTPRKQREFIQNLGGVADLTPIEAGHEVMLTHPIELANVLAELVDTDRTVQGRP